MGQYFTLANLDKKEYVCPWCLGGGAKLWEWAANANGSVLTILLRKSDEGGGGDAVTDHGGGFLPGRRVDRAGAGAAPDRSASGIIAKGG